MVAFSASLHGDDCRKEIVIYRDSAASQDQCPHGMIQGLDNYNWEGICVVVKMSTKIMKAKQRREVECQERVRQSDHGRKIASRISGSSSFEER